MNHDLASCNKEMKYVLRHAHCFLVEMLQTKNQRRFCSLVHFLPVNTMDLPFFCFIVHILTRLCRPPKTLDKVSLMQIKKRPRREAYCIFHMHQHHNSNECLHYEKLSYLTKFPKHQPKKLAHCSPCDIDSLMVSGTMFSGAQV